MIPNSEKFWIRSLFSETSCKCLFGTIGKFGGKKGYNFMVEIANCFPVVSLPLLYLGIELAEF